MAAPQFTILRVVQKKPVAEYLKRRGNRYQLDYHALGKRFRKTLAAQNERDAIIESEPIINDYVRTIIDDPWAKEISAAGASRKHWLYKLYQCAKHRAAKYGKEFSITYFDVAEIAFRCDGYCEVTGLALVPSVGGRHRANPVQPSLDRIDSTRGYVKGNVRMVCYAANLAMGIWGQELLEKMAISTVVKLGVTLQNRHISESD